MQWKTKAAIQSFISKLPSSMSYHLYYFIQRNFGNLRRPNIISRLEAGKVIWQQLLGLGHDPKGKVFFEVGTGRITIIPLSYWLMGAKKVITVDLNPYLKDELLNEAVTHIIQNKDEIKKIFGNILVEERFKALVNLYESGNFSTQSFLKLCEIQYIAPGDAAATGLEDNSVNFHTSFTVLEHIPKPILLAIFEEGARLLDENGLFVHNVDYTDHFSHSDKNISCVNFLQFSDMEWDKLAGNRYMYMNRMRHDDFLSIYNASNHEIIKCTPFTDARSIEVLNSKEFNVNEKFRDKPTEVLAISGAVWVTKAKQIEKN